MTAPSGTVMLGALVMAPTVRPALVSISPADACGWPTTSGTIACGTPEEMTSATAVPTSRSVPTNGSWLMTDPAGTVMLGAVANAPTDDTVSWYVPATSPSKKSGILTLMSL